MNGKMASISPVWGAAAGDVVGSVYEHRPHKSEDFPLLDEASRFTDDTVLTAAIAHAVTHGEEYGRALRRFGRAHPEAGYGASFHAWLANERIGAYHSFGNGAAMRVSPVGAAFASREEVLEQAARSAAVTHDHPEGIKGARATALAIHLARQGRSKAEIRDNVEAESGYDLHRSLDAIRPTYRFDVSCQGSVPESIIAFLESDGTEDAIRKAVSLGGDADTMACIAGGIAAAFHGEAPADLVTGVRNRLADDLRRALDDLDRALAGRSGSGPGPGS